MFISDKGNRVNGLIEGHRFHSAEAFSAVDGERVLVAINAEEQPYTAHFDAGCGRAVDLITGQEHDFGGGSELPGYSAYFWKCER